MFINSIFDWIYFVLLIQTIFCSSFAQNCSFTSLNHHWPTLQVVLFVHPHNKLHVLPYTLSSLDQQDYPRDRIKIYVHTELYEPVQRGLASDISSIKLFHNWQTVQALKRWRDSVRGEYQELDLHVEYETVKSISAVKSENSEPIVYWNEERFKKIIKLRNRALQLAKRNWADLILFMDADVILTNRSTLSEVIQFNHQKDVFAPMLYSEGTYSNFWAGMTESGYYQRTDDYVPILERNLIGSHKVPMVHSCFFINLKSKHAVKSLNFNPDSFNPTAPLDDMITFGLLARKHQVSMWVDNRHAYGYVMPPIEQENDQKSRNQLINLQLDHLIDHNRLFPLIDDLESFVHSTPIQSLPDIDNVYVINLKRRRDRRDRMLASLQLLGIRAQLWPAVDGKLLNKQFLKEQQITLMSNYADPFHQRPMTFGEVGCFMSHYNVWKDVIVNNFSMVLVLEDDVRFDAYFRPRLQTLIESLQDIEFDLLYIGRKRQAEDNQEPFLNAYTVLPAYSYWTIGYVLTGSGARKLVNAKPLQRLLPVDEFLPIMFDQHPNSVWRDQFEERNLTALSAQPLLVEPIFYVGDQRYVSDTEYSEQINLLHHHHHHHPKHEEL